jgi:hypothetical protein
MTFQEAAKLVGFTDPPKCPDPAIQKGAEAWLVRTVQDVVDRRGVGAVGAQAAGIRELFTRSFMAPPGMHF